MILLNMICLYIQYNDQHLTELPISSNQSRLICKRIHLHVNLISIWRDNFRVQGSSTYYQFSELVMQGVSPRLQALLPNWKTEET